MRTLEKELETYFDGNYRRIWIQTTRLGSICLTLFRPYPDQDYMIITEKDFGEVTFEKVRDLIMKS